MAGKRKASDDAPGSLRPPPARRGAGIDDEVSSLSESSGDSRSDAVYLGDSEHSSGYDHLYGGGSSEGSEIAMEASLALQDLQIGPSNLVPGGTNQPAGMEVQPPPPPSPTDQPSEAEVHPPPPADEPAAAEVADQSVAAAAAAPEMVMLAPDSVLCPACGREPASVCLVPVDHPCLCLSCRSNPSGRPRCEFCDGPRC